MMRRFHAMDATAAARVAMGGARAPHVASIASSRCALCVVLLASVHAAGCGGAGGGEAARHEPRGADWSGFAGSRDPIDPKSVRVVPTEPIEITGVPYVRAIRLAWSSSPDVPSFEPANQTLHLPEGSLQAVLLVTVADLPEEATVRVDWYYGDRAVFADELRSRENGDHYFALIKEAGRRLAPLPGGGYRADVSDGSRVIKSVRFEVAG